MSSDSSREVAVVDEPDADDREPADVDDTSAAEPEQDTVHDEADVQADETADDDADDAEPSSDGAAKAGRSELLPKRLVLGSAALAIASFIVAAVFGVLWFFSTTGDRAELASARESVIDAAGTAVQAITEVDYRKPDEFFTNVKAISTDKFAQSLTGTEKRLRKALSQAKTTVETDVLDVAVQTLNPHKGTATFLAVIKTTITQGDKSRPKLMRLQGKMQRVSTDGSQAWKLSDIGQVPVIGAAAPQGKGQGQGQGQGAGKSNGGN